MSTPQTAELTYLIKLCKSQQIASTQARTKELTEVKIEGKKQR